MESIKSNFSPLIFTYSTPEVTSLLQQRASLSSLSSLFLPFQNSIQNVAVRSSTFESSTLPGFPIKFIERTLPSNFLSSTSSSGRRASVSLGSGGGGGVKEKEPTTPFITTNQEERDELFLDSLNEGVGKKVDDWINQVGREELKVKRPIKVKRVYADDDDDDALPPSSEEEIEVEEGWESSPLSSLTPWYTSLVSQILSRRSMVSWETFAHPIAVLLAVSTDHPDPLNALSALWELTSKENLFKSDGEGVEWANGEVLRYVVLVHDTGKGGGRDALEDAQQLHETISKTYLHHTALLPLFSASETAAKPLPKAQGLDQLWPSRLPKDAIVPSSPLVEDGGVGLGFGLEVEVEEGETERVGKEIEVKVKKADESEKEEKGKDLSEEDLKNIRQFLREMVVQSIIPWIERAVVVGNEQFTASKRSIGGRLFSAGRKYFGASSTTRGSPTSANGSPLGYNAVKGYYPIAAQEAQTRRLADLAFVIGDYKLASSVYEQASRDFKQDKAWKYYSSACRMTGLSQLLLHSPKTALTFNPDVWLEQALQIPASDYQGGVDLDGLKSMMLYYECYRIIGDWRPAPVGLVRTAGESDELASALLLEQAAIADLHLPLPSRRKFGFHMSMAAARYEKCGLKSLSRRCLSQASSLYKPFLSSSLLKDPRYSSEMRNWQAIRNHLHYGLGRQAYNVGKSGEAVGHFLELIVGDSEERGFGGEGEEGEGEEKDWLDDFGLAWEHLGPSASTVVAEKGLKLQATIFDPRDAVIRLASNGKLVDEVDLDATSEEWTKLEEELGLSQIQKGRRPVEVEKKGKGKENVVVVGETFYLELVARNPLDSPLAIGGLKIETDAEEGLVEIEAPQEIELEPRQSLRIYVPIRATSLITFSFTQLSFRFNDLLPCTETLIGHPIRLAATRANPSLATYVQNSSLKVLVRSLVPILSISLEELSSTLYAGEGRMSTLILTNTGQVPLSELKGLCSHPSFALFQPQPHSPQETSTPIYSTVGENALRKPHTIPNHLTPNTPFTIPFSDASNTLLPGSSIRVPILLRGDSQGIQNLRWLFTFRNPDETEVLTAKASHQLEVLPSLDIRPLVRPGHSLDLPFLISVEVHNSAIPAEVVIDQIASVAIRWRCESVTSSGSEEPLAVLDWQQAANLFVGIKPVLMAKDEGSTFSVEKLDDLLQGKDVKRSVPGSTDLLFGSSTPSRAVDLTANPLFPSILRTHVQLRHRSLTNQLPTIPSALHQYLFTLFNARSIDLLVFWSIPSYGISGHHHLADIPLGAGANTLKQVLETAELKAGGLYAESQRERSTLLAGLRRSELGVDANPSEVVVEVEELIDHDFEEGPCVVPVLFFVRNLSTTHDLKFSLWLQNSDTISSANASSPNRLPYAGSLSHHGSVSSLSFARVEGTLWISKPGSYNVGDWRLESVSPSGEWQRSGSPRMVRIRSK